MTARDIMFSSAGLGGVSNYIVMADISTGAAQDTIRSVAVSEGKITVVGSNNWIAQLDKKSLQPTVYYTLPSNTGGMAGFESVNVCHFIRPYNNYYHQTFKYNALTNEILTVESSANNYYSTEIRSLVVFCDPEYGSGSPKMLLSTGENSTTPVTKVVISYGGTTFANRYNVSGQYTYLYGACYVPAVANGLIAVGGAAEPLISAFNQNTGSLYLSKYLVGWGSSGDRKFKGCSKINSTNTEIVVAGSVEAPTAQLGGGLVARVSALLTSYSWVKKIYSSSSTSYTRYENIVVIGEYAYAVGQIYDAFGGIPKTLYIGIISKFRLSDGNHEWTWGVRFTNIPDYPAGIGLYNVQADGDGLIACGSLALGSNSSRGFFVRIATSGAGSGTCLIGNISYTYGYQTMSVASQSPELTAVSPSYASTTKQSSTLTPSVTPLTVTTTAVTI